MNFHKQKEPLPIWLNGDAIDQLIYQSLLAEVRGAEPPPRVWETICQRIMVPSGSRAVGRSKMRVRSFLDGILILFDNNRLYDRSWEARLSERRPLFFWQDHLLQVV